MSKVLIMEVKNKKGSCFLSKTTDTNVNAEKELSEIKKTWVFRNVIILVSFYLLLQKN